MLLIPRTWIQGLQKSMANVQRKVSLYAVQFHHHQHAKLTRKKSLLLNGLNYLNDYYYGVCFGICFDIQSQRPNTKLIDVSYFIF